MLPMVLSILCLMFHYRKPLQVNSATMSLKYLAVTKILIKPLFVYKMYKHIFQKTDALSLALISWSCITPDVLCQFDMTQIISSSRETKEQAYVIVTFVSLVWEMRVVNAALLYFVCSRYVLQCCFKIVFIIYSCTGKNYRKTATKKYPILIFIQFKYSRERK